MALTAAESVKRSGRPFKLSPMTPDERRIVHLAIADDGQIRTESEGFGEHRKVVIYPREMHTLLEDTIAAVSTPWGKGGIGIIRLSGSESVAVAGSILSDSSRMTQYYVPFWPELLSLKRVTN